MAEAVVTQAPKIVALRPVADRTLSVPGSAAAIGATALVAQKGRPFVPLLVNADTMQTVLGKPLPSTEGSNAEGMRHLSDALQGCQSAYVVRVVAQDFRFPAITLPVNGNATKSNHALGTDVALGAGSWFAIWSKDGHSSSDRRISIVDIDTENQRFDLLIEEKRSGEWLKLERFDSLGASPDDKDDMGIPAYAPAVLESRSPYFDCAISIDVDFNALKEVKEVVFEGGTSGGDPTVADFKKAWDVLKHSDYSFNIPLMAGQYDFELIKHAEAICDELLLELDFDAPPWFTEEQVRDWLISLNMGYSYQSACYHYPYKANDKFYGGKTVWGVSGEVAATRARCYTTTTGHADIPGVHFAPAGEIRGVIRRSGIEPLHTTGFITAEEKTAIKNGKQTVGRFNPVDQGTIIGDELTMYARHNYLRFRHIVAIHNEIVRKMIAAARSLKFEPDGLTREGLERMGNEICQKYVESGALVRPRNPEEDGFEPYRLVINQEEIDSWKIEPWLCPTGVFRRGAVQAVLMK